MYIEELPVDFPEATQPHQDDHYLFVLLTAGKGKLEIEKETFQCEAPALVVIKPLQVHFSTRPSAPTGWAISCAPFLIPNALAAVLPGLDIRQQYVPLTNAEDLFQIAAVLQTAFNTSCTTNKHKPAILKGLGEAFFHRILPELEMAQDKTIQLKGQPAVITRQFMQLLQQQPTGQTPAYFARQMHITTAHLNDCVRETTGFPVTYWRQYAMLHVAKRLLYYTDKPVKTIAWELGFEDHTYFSRLFRKLTGETPGAFRNKFHE
ncbi:AraC-like DNA-binding protein [Chitinophaga ginsengisoli]|uniref:AraC-like DNA-binding protein n=2 Tax=Chitinophaga ginsengisoli TaxID=363837 RepID=A0A2P8GDC1_9BACT|nr:AraC-like DNA-binding protein [Chitinophaga ginsengisoli]